MRCRSRSVVAAGHGDGVLGGRRRCIFLEDGLDLHVGTRHEELIVLDGHAAADDLPLLEVVALVGRGGQGERRTSRSGGRSCGASAVSVITDGDGVGGGGNNAVFPQRLDFGIPVHCVGISHLVLCAANLPSLELLIGGSGEAAGGQDVICPCLDGHGSHAAAAAVAVKGDNEVRKRLSIAHGDLRIGAGKVVVILRIADEVIAGGQVLNLRAAARRIAAFACHTVFHLVGHACDFSVAAALSGRRDTDQAGRRFLRGFADAPRCGHGVGAAVRPFARLGCDANGVIARIRGGVACDVHCGRIITNHGRGMLGAIVSIGSDDADAGFGGIGRRRRCVLLEDSLDLHVVVRHEELVVHDCHAAADDLPLLEVIAGFGRSGQANLRAGHGFCMRSGSRTVAAAGHGDGELGGHRRCVLLEDGLDLHVAVRHGELIVLDGHAAADDLPLLEAVASVRRGSQGDFLTGNSLCRRCGSRSVALCGHGDGVLGRGGRRVLPQRLDCDVSGDGHGGVHRILRTVYLPCLELLSFGRNKLALRQIIRAAVQYLLGGHCGGDLLGQILRLGAAVRVKRDGMLVALFKRCGYGDVFLRLGEGIGIVSNRNGGGDTVNGQRAKHIALVGGDGEHNKLVLKEQRLAVLGGFCGIYHRYTAVCAIRYRQRVARRARNRHGYLGFSKLRLIRMQHDIRTRQVKRSVHGKALLPL